ncbi:hypothetical protein DM02DRAFT_544099, partial [Periconia macrospinosa]
AIKDETLFLVRCYKELILLQLISRHLFINKLKAFKQASIKYSTTNRVYYSNRACGKFILPR